MMAEYSVVIPIAGHAYKIVEADSEAEAIDKALETITIDDVDQWEGLKRYHSGNVCHCPGPWEAEAELA
jgi:hypothetical protein